MDEFLHRRAGPVTGSARVAAFHAERPDKDRTVTVESLIAEWRRRASDFGFDLGDLTRAVGPHRPDPRPAIHPADLRRRLEPLAREHRSVARQDLVVAVASSSPFGAVGPNVEAEASRLWESSGAAEGRAGTEPGTLRGPAPRWDADRVDRVVRSVERGRLERSSRAGGRPGQAARPPDLERGAGPQPERTVGPGHPGRPAPRVVLSASRGVEW
jgi:hypothetical protein